MALAPPLFRLFQLRWRQLLVMTNRLQAYLRLCSAPELGQDL